MNQLQTFSKLEIPDHDCETVMGQGCETCCKFFDMMDTLSMPKYAKILRFHELLGGLMGRTSTLSEMFVLDEISAIFDDVSQNETKGEDPDVTERNGTSYPDQA